jgi:Flp pilus assembly protein TadB
MMIGHDDQTVRDARGTRRAARRRMTSSNHDDDDPEREPDGVPHDVVGLVALFTFLLAALVLVMFLLGPVGKVAAVVLGIAAAPAVIGVLRRRAERERDHDRPSR